MRACAAVQHRPSTTTSHKAAWRTRPSMASPSHKRPGTYGNPCTTSLCKAGLSTSPAPAAPALPSPLVPCTSQRRLPSPQHRWNDVLAATDTPLPDNRNKLPKASPAPPHKCHIEKHHKYRDDNVYPVHHQHTSTKHFPCAYGPCPAQPFCALHKQALQPQATIPRTQTFCRC